MRTILLGLTMVAMASGSALAEVSLRWGRPIKSCLDAVQGGRAGEVAANLDSRMRQGLDIGEERLKRLESAGVRTLSDVDALLRRSKAAAVGETRDALERIQRGFHALAPAIEYLQAKGLSPENLTPASAGPLAEALEAHSRKANLRARRIVAGFSQPARSPADVVKDAAQAEELVYRQYPYLEDMAWHRLLQVYEDLDARGVIARRKLAQERQIAQRAAAVVIARADREASWQVRDAVASSPAPRSLVKRVRAKCEAFVNRLRRFLSR